MPMLAATSGTLSMMAEAKPKNIIYSSLEIPDAITFFPSCSIIPKLSMPATVIRMPKKKRMEGISILLSAFRVGPTCPRWSCSLIELKFRWRLLAISPMIAKMANENSIPI